MLPVKQAKKISLRQVTHFFYTQTANVYSAVSTSPCDHWARPDQVNAEHVYELVYS